MDDGPQLVPKIQMKEMLVTNEKADLYLVYHIDTQVQYYFDLDLTEVTKGGKGYNPHLLPLAKVLKKE